MGNIMSDSNLSEAKRIAELYEKLLKINNENEKILDNYKKQLLNIMRIEQKTKIGKVNLIRKNVIDQMTIEEIKECFNGEKVLNHIVVRVDVQATLTNLKIKLGMNESTARNAINKLLPKAIITIPDLEVKERWSYYH